MSLSLAQTVRRPRGNPFVDDDASALDPLHTVLVMQMGQFIDHDVTHTPNHAINCCNNDGTFPDFYDQDKCFPIRLPNNDRFWNSRKQCMSMARSLAAPGLKCSLESRQQMNQITHWLDASNIYGSSERETKILRSFFGGQMRITRQSRSRFGNLPTCRENLNNHGAGGRDEPAVCEQCNQCFFAGDVRVNEQLNLVVMHTVWMREHNRVARFLSKLNPIWDDEKIFQEARRIVIAEYQHIIYKEWLPSILGSRYMEIYSLWPLTKGYFHVLHVLLRPKNNK